MNAPKVVPTVRQKIHLRFCHDLGTCKYVGGQGNRRRCDYLDELLDFNDEQLLHAKARELRDEAERVGLKRRDVPVAGGLLRASDMTDPYKEFAAFDPELDEVPHGLSEHPDCPSCVKGVEHFHRKSDGSPVVSPGPERGAQ